MRATSRSIILVFVPAILIVLAGFLVQIIRYAPKDPTALIKKEMDNKEQNQDIVPIFTDDQIIGQKNAATTAIVFADIMCSDCRSQIKIFQDITKKYPKKIKFIWKGLPVTRIPYPSDQANAYAYCAGKQEKFLPFVTEIINTGLDNINNVDLKTIAAKINLNENEILNCIQSGSPDLYQKKIEALARDLNIQSTPTIFINNKQIETPATFDKWESALNLSERR